MSARTKKQSDNVPQIPHLKRELPYRLSDIIRPDIKSTDIKVNARRHSKLLKIQIFGYSGEGLLLPIKSWQGAKKGKLLYLGF